MHFSGQGYESDPFEREERAYETGELDGRRGVIVTDGKVEWHGIGLWWLSWLNFVLCIEEEDAL